MAEAVVWLAIGGISAYFIGNKLTHTEQDPKIIPPPPRQKWVDPKIQYARMQTGSLEFYNIEHGGYDQYGIPYCYGIGMNGTKTRLYGDVDYLRSTMLRLPKTDSSQNASAQKGGGWVPYSEAEHRAHNADVRLMHGIRP